MSAQPTTGQSHTTAHCPRCHAQRTFQPVVGCVICGHQPADRAVSAARLAAALQHDDPRLSSHHALLAAYHALDVLDQAPVLHLIEGDAA